MSNCNTLCFKCEDPGILPINFSKYHKTCLVHYQAAVRLPTDFCIHCDSKILVVRLNCEYCYKNPISANTLACNHFLCEKCFENPCKLCYFSAHLCQNCKIFTKNLFPVACGHKLCSLCYNPSLSHCSFCIKLLPCSVCKKVNETVRLSNCNKYECSYCNLNCQACKKIFKDSENYDSVVSNLIKEQNFLNVSNSKCIMCDEFKVLKKRNNCNHEACGLCINQKCVVCVAQVVKDQEKCRVCNKNNFVKKRDCGHSLCEECLFEKKCFCRNSEINSCISCETQGKNVKKRNCDHFLCESCWKSKNCVICKISIKGHAEESKNIIQPSQKITYNVDKNSGIDKSSCMMCGKPSFLQQRQKCIHQACQTCINKDCIACERTLKAYSASVCPNCNKNSIQTKKTPCGHSCCKNCLTKDCLVCKQSSTLQNIAKSKCKMCGEFKNLIKKDCGHSCCLNCQDYICIFCGG